MNRRGRGGARNVCARPCAGGGRRAGRERTSRRLLLAYPRAGCGVPARVDEAGVGDAVAVERPEGRPAEPVACSDRAELVAWAHDVLAAGGSRDERRCAPRSRGRAVEAVARAKRPATGGPAACGSAIGRPGGAAGGFWGRGGGGGGAGGGGGRAGV